MRAVLKAVHCTVPLNAIQNAAFRYKRAIKMEEQEEAAVAIPEDGREFRVVLGRSLIGGGDGTNAAAHPAPSSLESTSGSGSAVMQALRGQPVAAASVTKASESVSAASDDAAGTGSSADEVFVSFRYEFQPASVDTRTPGLVTVDDSSGVQVLRGHSSGAPGGILFKGKAVENKETDCLLLFDGESFRLEKCPFSYTQLRHVRAPSASASAVASAVSATRRHAAKTPALAPAGSDAALAGTTETTESVNPDDAEEIDGETSMSAAAAATLAPTASTRGRGRGRGRGGRGPGRGRGKATAAGSAGTKVARGAKAAVVRTQRAAKAAATMTAGASASGNM